MSDQTSGSDLDAVGRETLARFIHNAMHRHHGCAWPAPTEDHLAAADALLARYDIRDRGETQAESRKPKDYLEEGERVSAHRLDRVRSVVVGTLVPYDESEGERVQDAEGVVWCVDASSVRPVPGDLS